MLRYISFVTALALVACDRDPVSPPVEPPTDSTSLVTVAELSGPVHDFDDGRALYTSADAVVTIRHFGSATDDSVMAVPGGHSPNAAVGVGFLTPLGALFTIRHTPGDAIMYEYRNGVLEQLAGGQPEVAGQYAIHFLNRTLFRKDLLTGDVVTVATPYNQGGTSPGIEATEPDVASNGDVIYRHGAGAIMLYRGGVTTTVQPDSMERLVTSPQTADGWVAWIATRPGTRQLWVRRPAGEVRQLVSSPDTLRVEDLSAQGEVVYVTDEGRFVVGRSVVTPERIGSALGRALWRNGRLIVLQDRSVLAVD